MALPPVPPLQLRAALERLETVFEETGWPLSVGPEGSPWRQPLPSKASAAEGQLAQVFESFADGLHEPSFRQGLCTLLGSSDPAARAGVPAGAPPLPAAQRPLLPTLLCATLRHSGAPALWRQTLRIVGNIAYQNRSGCESLAAAGLLPLLVELAAVVGGGSSSGLPPDLGSILLGCLANLALGGERVLSGLAGAEEDYVNHVKAPPGEAGPLAQLVYHALRRRPDDAMVARACLFVVNGSVNPKVLAALLKARVPVLLVGHLAGLADVVRALRQRAAAGVAGARATVPATLGPGGHTPPLHASATAAFAAYTQRLIGAPVDTGVRMIALRALAPFATDAKGQYILGQTLGCHYALPLWSSPEFHAMQKPRPAQGQRGTQRQSVASPGAILGLATLAAFAIHGEQLGLVPEVSSSSESDGASGSSEGGSERGSEAAADADLADPISDLLAHPGHASLAQLTVNHAYDNDPQLLACMMLDALMRWDDNVYDYVYYLGGMDQLLRLLCTATRPRLRLAALNLLGSVWRCHRALSLFVAGYPSPRAALDTLGAPIIQILLGSTAIQGVLTSALSQGTADAPFTLDQARGTQLAAFARALAGASEAGATLSPLQTLRIVAKAFAHLALSTVLGEAMFPGNFTEGLVSGAQPLAELFAAEPNLESLPLVVLLLRMLLRVPDLVAQRNLVVALTNLVTDHKRCAYMVLRGGVAHALVPILYGCRDVFLLLHGALAAANLCLCPNAAAKACLVGLRVQLPRAQGPGGNAASEIVAAAGALDVELDADALDQLVPVPVDFNIMQEVGLVDVIQYLARLGDLERAQLTAIDALGSLARGAGPAVLAQLVAQPGLLEQLIARTFTLQLRALQFSDPNTRNQSPWALGVAAEPESISGIPGGYIPGGPPPDPVLPGMFVPPVPAPSATEDSSVSSVVSLPYSSPPQLNTNLLHVTIRFLAYMLGAVTEAAERPHAFLMRLTSARTEAATSSVLESGLLLPPACTACGEMQHWWLAQHEGQRRWWSRGALLACVSEQIGLVRTRYLAYGVLHQVARFDPACAEAAAEAPSIRELLGPSFLERLQGQARTAWPP